MRADLHLHSHYSDGSESPTEVVERARAAGLDLIALSDHDSMGGLAEAQAAGRAAGIEVLPAAEFTAVFRGQEIHLLGYFPTDPGREVEAHLEGMQAFRRQRLETALERLRAGGLPLRFEELPCAPCCQSVTTAHLAILLARRGYAPSVRAAWRKFMDSDRGVVPAFAVTVEVVLEAIHTGGGLAVWAHPGRRRFRAWLEELAGLGMDGVEVANLRRGLEPAREWRVLAGKLKLVSTGGSDWHGGTPLGTFAASEELLGDFLDRLGQQRHSTSPKPHSASNPVGTA